MELLVKDLTDVCYVVLKHKDSNAKAYQPLPQLHFKN